MSQSRAVLIVTGAWHIAQHYHKLKTALEVHGIRTICETLPTNNNAIPPNKTLHDDVEFIKNIVSKETAVGTHLTIIAHSWGGIVSSGALASFAVPRESQHGGVTDLIFMSAFIPGEDQSLASLFGGQLPPYLTPDNNDLLVWTDPIDHLFNDVEEAEAKWAEENRVVHSASAQHTALNVDKVAWRVIPLSYIVCENDKALPAFVQNMMVDRVESEGVAVTRYSIEASHSPFLSTPDKVAEIVCTVMG